MSLKILTRAKDEIKWRMVWLTVKNPDANWFDSLCDGLTLERVWDIIVVNSDGRVHNTMGLDAEATVTIDGATDPLHEMVNQLKIDTKSITISRQEAPSPPIVFHFGDFMREADATAFIARTANDVLTSDLTAKEERSRAWSSLRDVQNMAESFADDCDKLLDMAPEE